METIIFVTAFICLVYAVYKVIYPNQHWAKAPPSFPCLPVIGSLPFLTSIDNLHVFFMEKAKTYGNVFGLYAGKNYTLILNGQEAIREALEKRSSDFAGRRDFHTDRAILNVERRGISMKQYGEEYKQNQKLCMSTLKQLGFGDRAIMEYKIHAEVTELIAILKTKKGAPFHPSDLLELTAFNVIFNLMLGERYSADDPMGKYQISCIRQCANSYDPVLDIFPIVENLPKYRTIMKDLKVTSEKITKFYVDKIRECINRDDDDENFVKEYIKKAGANCDLEELMFIIRDIVMAGTETTSTFLSWCLVTICNRPELQKRLQKEIDSVVPRDRFPSLDDKKKLNYVEATILEILRMRTLVPLGVPRCTMCDTEVSGYKIPADSLVLVNLHSANMNPEVWPEPEVCRPERFLDTEGNIINKDQMLSFSLGKRSCLGEVLARQEISLFLTAILQNFNIMPPVGKTSIVEKMTVIRVMTPAHYEVRFIPRE
jgi:cytochrome P450